MWPSGTSDPPGPSVGWHQRCRQLVRIVAQRLVDAQPAKREEGRTRRDSGPQPSSDDEPARLELGEGSAERLGIAQPEGGSGASGKAQATVGAPTVLRGQRDEHAMSSMRQRGTCRTLEHLHGEPGKGVAVPTATAFVE
ncbi:MAG: hypothetical protein ACRENK_08390 [Gemmatimonadaceae bacterium]